MPLKTMKLEISRAAIELETALRDVTRPRLSAASTAGRIAFDNQDAGDVNADLDRELCAQLRHIAAELRYAAQRAGVDAARFEDTNI
jgi:hypothetical protein